MRTYTEICDGLSEVVSRNTTNRTRLSRARSEIVTAKADLTAMQTAYGGLLSDVAALAAADPANAALAAADAKAKLLRDDFLRLKTEATSMDDALPDPTI